MNDYQLIEDLKNVLNSAQDQKQKIVLVTGVFDLLHQEHLFFLKKALALGDILLIGVESDQRVKQLKGKNRPINKLAFRIKNLEMKMSKNVQIFALPEEFSSPAAHRHLIKMIKPDYLAVSSHTDHLVEKRRILKNAGGELVIVHQHNPKISSTQIIQNH